MQIFLDSYGAFLGVQEGMFWVKPLHNEGRSFAVRNVNAIFLTKGVRVSTDALMLALEHSIPVLLIDHIGHPVGQVWSGQFGSVATIRKNQALFACNVACMGFMREVILEKLEKQQMLLREWQERFPQQYAFQKALPNVLGIIEKMRDNFAQWQPDKKAVLADIAGTFRGWEGTGTKYFFQALSLVLPEQYQFKGRSKRPAYDNFNALLNYLYGILYAQVELALMKAGLDPYTGFLHADQYNRPTLVYDIIEWVRHWAEAVAVNLCAREQLPNDAFVQPSEREGIFLNGRAKDIAVAAMLAFMNEKITHKGSPRKRVTHLDMECVRLASLLKDWGSNT